MKLYDKIPNYVKLDDDVSFQILRTNPNLTTNTKLMYDGEKIYMESYSANTLLSTKKYKNHRVWKTSMYNKDIKNFLLGTSSSAYDVCQNMENTIIGDSFDNQFENMYWSGAESINSSVYPQELGFVAPLYLRKKLPNYFVIFKIEGPANTNLTLDNGIFKDDSYDFNTDILNNAKIIKTFDLREGTPIGNYIRNYVGQKDFKYDKSIYVNFAAKEIYYYGIDKGLGVLTEKVESISEQMLENDNTILRTDDWITNGFARNNLIFPYIINFEFLFDDNETGEYQFARYFGIYCNDIDLHDVDIDNFYTKYVNGKKMYNISTSTKSESIYSIDLQVNQFHYLKDKFNNLHTIEPGFRVSGNLNKDDFMGFEPSSISTYCERIDGIGQATMVLKINKPLLDGDCIYIYDNLYSKEKQGESIYLNNDGERDKSDCYVKLRATSQLKKNYYNGLIFSSEGTIVETAKTIASVITEYDKGIFQWLRSYASGNKVIIQSSYTGSAFNNTMDVGFDDDIIFDNRIEKIIDNFDGGTDVEGCLFKIYTKDKDIFFDYSGADRDSSRYIKSYDINKSPKIIRIMPYINDDYEVDEEYSVMYTDNNGRYATVSKTNQIEIIDKYYAKVGILSMFPVKDFDFDTVYSSYGNDEMLKQEISNMNDYLESNNKIGTTFNVKIIADFDIPECEKENVDNITFELETIHTSSVNKSLSSVSSQIIPYGRFFFDNGDVINNEYDYYFENIIPELSVLNKTVPFISKWGYMDDCVDSCENPYRLNTTKIFETCNFSANTFIQKGDIMEYTHSMPYYIVNGVEENINEYQYIDNITEISSNDTDIVYKWIKYFSDSKIDRFDEMFGDSSYSKFNSKRYKKKYSRFLLGSDINNASTIFRGVKFEIIDIVNGKEVNTGKYNDYKFSFIYIPVNNKSEFISSYDSETGTYTYDFDKGIYFMKNDDFKFVIGMVFFYTFGDEIDPNVLNMGFNKAFVYAGCLGYDFYIGGNSDSDGLITDSDLYKAFNKMTINNIKTNINNELKVQFSNKNGNISNSYKIKVKDPDSINTYDIFTITPVMTEDNEKSVIGSVDVTLKSDVNNLNIKIINRYSGYYNPIFKNIIFYKDFNSDKINSTYGDRCSYSNTSFDYNYIDNHGEFGIIKNLWFHKVNEDKSIEIINTLTPYYPLTGQYALDYKDYNIFSSSWDKDYYTRQLDTNNMIKCDNIASMKNGLCMFGSKYLNVPETIEIECLSGCAEWDDDRITNTNGFNEDIMYKEINDNSVNFYLFLHKRLLKFFSAMLFDEFSKYINPTYSFGTTDTINDDIEEYVKKNILKLYKLDKIRVFIKRTNSNAHNSRIENNYSDYLGYTVNELKKAGFVEVNNLIMSKENVDDFDRKLVYNLRSGVKEDFGFSFVVKKI